jgi:hypothetical protein
MSLEDKINNIYSFYKEETKTVLSLENFKNLILTYPAFKVAACDGDFALKERGFLFDICQALIFENDPDKEDQVMAAEIYAQYNYLFNKKSWEVLFLDLIKEFLEQNSDAKGTILEMIIGVAEVHEGISNREKQTIDDLKSILKL